MKGEHLLRFAIATVLAALFAAAPGAGLGSAETEAGVSTVTVEMRLWQDVHNAENVWISARPEGGSWRALGTIPFPLDADDGAATYRYRDLAIAGAELRVWQKRDESERFYVRACGSACPEEAPFEARSRIRVPLDDGHSSSGRYRYGDLIVAVPLAGRDLRTYLEPVPQAVVVGEQLVFGVYTDVEAPSTIRIGPSAGNTAVAILEDACPSAPALPEGGGYPYHHRDWVFESSGTLYLTGCAVGTTEIQIYQGTTLLQSYPVRVTERTLVALSDGTAGELVLTWSDAMVGASTATGWQYRMSIWGREGGEPNPDAPRTWESWTTIPGDGTVRRYRVAGLDEDWPYDFEVRPLAASGAGMASNIGVGVTARVGTDGIPRLNVPFLTATGFGDGGGHNDQTVEGGRTYRLGDSDMVITIPAGLNVTNTLVANDIRAGLIFALTDVTTGNWVTFNFAFHEVERSVEPGGTSGDGATPDPNDLFDQMVDSIRAQPEPPTEEPSAAGAPSN